VAGESGKQFAGFAKSLCPEHWQKQAMVSVTDARKNILRGHQKPSWK
jgi:hypothetical protein